VSVELVLVSASKGVNTKRMRSTGEVHKTDGTTEDPYERTERLSEGQSGSPRWR